MKTNSQGHSLQKPEGFDTISLRLTKGAVDWLSSASKRRDSEPLDNVEIFFSLIARMFSTIGDNSSPAFSISYSEPQLSREWQMGRTALRSILSRMEETGLVSLRKTPSGSVMTFPCLGGFSRDGSPFATNPEYAYRRRR